MTSDDWFIAVQVDRTYLWYEEFTGRVTSQTVFQP